MPTIRILTAGIAAVVCLACGSYGTDTVGGPLDRNGLVEGLRGAGVTVEVGGDIQQPFFSVAGRTLMVNGQTVQVFEYASEAAMQREAALVSPDGGTIGTSSILWTATPHFYRKGLLIVVYLGADPAVRRALESVLGPQFAGG